MKIFWVINADEGDRCRCFFRTSRTEAQADVDFRMEEAKEDLEMFGFCCDQWEIEEEEVPDNLFGVCINSPEPYKLALPTCPDCSVGMIRKYRNNVDKDNGMCGTCPYFSYSDKF